MGKVRSRIDKGFLLVPEVIEAGEDLTLEGEVGVDSSDDKLKVRLDSATRSVVTEDQIQDLSNKGIDADDNNIANIEVDNLKAGVLNVSTSLSGASDTQVPSTLAVKTYADNIAASEAGDVQTNLDNHINDTVDVHGLAGGAAVVGTTSTQTITNKTITGASVQTPSRLDAKQDTKANLVTYAISAANGQFCFATDEKTMYQVVDGFLVSVGGGVGGINYILNSDAENDTTGYSRYNDGASVNPVDGTGGTPSVNLTFTRSTSAPLRNTASFLITKAAANMQGYGVSYDFNIDSADQAQILRSSFDYSSTSGYADDYLRVYIYDRTNSQLIEIIDRTISASTQGKYVASWQSSSNSTAYSLIFHVADSSSTAWDMKLDNIVVGPQTLIKGAVITNWVDFTPSFTNLTLGNGTLSGWMWRQVGSDMEIKGQLTFGTTTSISGSVSFTIPNSQSVSSAFADNSVGRTFLIDASTTANRVFGTASTTASGTSITLTYAAGNLSATTPFTWTTGDIIDIEKISVPIQGWSSNLVLSEDAGNRLIVARAVLTSDQAIATTSNTTVVFNEATLDTTASINTSTGLWTCPESGYYDISSQITIFNLTALDAYAINILKNGSQILQTVTRIVQTDSSQSFTIRTVQKLVKGDTIGVGSNSGSDGSYSVSGGASGAASELTWLSIYKIVSPQTLAGSETVSARYYASTTSLSGTPATIVWSTKDSDTHASMSTGLYTVPQSGYYQVNAALAISGTFVLNNANLIEIQRDSVAVSNVTKYTAAAVTNETIQISDTVYCSKGQVIRIQASSGATTPAIVSSNTKNFVSIAKVG